MGSSTKLGLIMAQGQEENDNSLGRVFFYLIDNSVMLSVRIRIASMRQF